MAVENIFVLFVLDYNGKGQLSNPVISVLSDKISQFIVEKT